jgi:aspartyl-tRNA(Asn)/glutamyl-tRNA(Gln) amidotransferase subunit A
VPKEYFIDGMHPDVELQVRNAIKQLERMGAKVSEVSLPHTKYSIPTYYIIISSEISSNKARYDGVRYGPGSQEAEGLYEHYTDVRGRGFGDEMKRRIMLGTYSLSSGYYDAYYLKAQKVRTLVRQDFDAVFKQVDVLVTPTSPHVAFKVGTKTDDPLQMYLEDVFTGPMNLAGIPSLCLPCGFAKPTDGDQEMPVGMQIIGPQFSEQLLLQVGYAYQQMTDWHLKKPNL